MHPIERLRSVARAGDVDPVILAREAAYALGALVGDPRALVPACRRLLEFHPECAPLWWICARLLAASDIEDAAYLSAQLLEDDPTKDELAVALPSGSTVVSDAGPASIAALAQRPDVTVRLVGSPKSVRFGVRRIDNEVSVYDSSEADAACSRADVVLVEVIAAGPSGVCLGAESSALASGAERSDVELWAVIGEGRLLPQRLFDAFCDHLDFVGSEEIVEEEWPNLAVPVVGVRPSQSEYRPKNGDVVLVPPSRLRRIIGPAGTAVPTIGLGRTTCVAPVELLEPSRGG
jgi:hypothetical protein